MFRVCLLARHGRLTYPLGSGRLTLGGELLPLIPANDIFYDAPKLRARLDETGYLYLKNIIPRQVVNDALDDLANQMRGCGWTLEADRRRQAARDGFAMGVCYPSTAAAGAELPPPDIAYTDTIRRAVSGTSVMAAVRQVFGGTVQACPLQTLQLGAPGEPFGLRMSSVLMNRGTKLALVALVPLHDTPLHMGAPVVVRASNSSDSYSAVRQTYGQWEVESGDVRGDGCFTHDPHELAPMGKQMGTDDVSGLPTIVDVNPFLSSALEAGDVLLMTVYTMTGFLTNQSGCWRIMGEAVWTMDGDDVGPDPRYVGADPPGLSRWLAARDDPAVYPRSMQQAKRDWGLLKDFTKEDPSAAAAAAATESEQTQSQKDAAKGTKFSE